MGIEVERKFLCNYIPEGLPNVRIKQGYLMSDDDKQLRVRIVDDVINGKLSGYLTFKQDDPNSKVSRAEFEYEIPINDAFELYFKCEYTLEKIRYKSTYYGNTIDIDVYPNGLKIVEIEYHTNIGEQLPDYVGDEVTGMKQYSNINIAKNII